MKRPRLPWRAAKPWDRCAGTLLAAASLVVVPLAADAGGVDERELLPRKMKVKRRPPPPPAPAQPPLDPRISWRMDPARAIAVSAGVGPAPPAFAVAAVKLHLQPRLETTLQMPAGGAPSAAPGADAVVAASAAAPEPAPPPSAPESPAVAATALTAASAAAVASIEWTDVPLELVINGEPRGEQVLKLSPDGAWLMPRETLAELGVQVPANHAQPLAGVPHVVLNELPDTRVVFDEKNLLLALTLPPELFPPQQRSLSTRPAPKVALGADTSALVNYRLGHFWGEGLEPETTLATELALRRGNVLLASDLLHVHQEEGLDTIRFHSQLVHDDRFNMRRLIIGDSFASSGELGSTLNLGGISFRKSYALSPYFVHQPTAAIRGAAGLPSDVRVYVGETQVFGQRLAPGPFELRDFSYYGGRQDVKVVVRDASGRETVYQYPFYFTDLALAAGLHDYSYSAGWVRENFGVESDQYGPPAASAYHRYGVTDHLTLGLRGEWFEDQGNWGPLAALRSNRLGVLTLAFAQGQRGGARQGEAWSAGYWYQYHGFNARAAVREQTRDYVNGLQPTLLAPLLRERMAGVGYGTRRLGTTDLQLLEQDAVGQPPERSLGLHYSRSLLAGVSLFASVRRNLHGSPDTELFAGVAYSPKAGVSMSGFHSQFRGGESEVLQYSDLPGTGEGLGYRVGVEQNRSAQYEATRLSPYVEYNTRYATVLAEDYAELGEDGEFRDYRQAAVEGALTWVGGYFAPTRRVHDSFALARLTAPVEGVRVYHNGQLVGRTNADGVLPIPHLGSFYANPVGIEHKDLPIEYNVASLQHLVAPSWRGGALVEFPLHAPKRVAGRLVRPAADGRLLPLAYHAASLDLQGQALAFATGADGGFYLEELQAGQHEGRVELAGGSCRFVLTVPDQSVVVIELEEPVRCESAP